MAMKDPRAREEASALARELADRLAALAAAARDEVRSTERRLGERLDESASHGRRLEEAFAEGQERVSGQISSLAQELSGALEREAAAREALERDRDARFEALARRQERDAEDDAARSRELGALREDVRQLRRERADGGAGAREGSRRAAGRPLRVPPGP